MDFLGNLEQHGHRLYMLLLRDYYYDYINLFARRQLAEYEDSGDLESDLAKLNLLINSPGTQKSERILTAWLEEVDFRFLPKKVTFPTQKDFEEQKDEKNNETEHSECTSESTKDDPCSTFISNLRTANEYTLEDIHYFAHIPVPLLLVSMLWSVTVGVWLDRKLRADCFGNRLDLDRKDELPEEPFIAFKYYLPEYNRWRDQAIDISLQSLRAGNDILLIALDIKHCFYKLVVHWEDIEQIMLDANLDEKLFTIHHLLKRIHKAYHQKTTEYLKITHHDGEDIQGIPIGLPSSKIIANYELSKLDEQINSKLRPIYYGRYVDDILIVLNNPNLEDGNMHPKPIIKTYFVDTGILKEAQDSKGAMYKVCEYEHLEIQKGKLILHFYDHESSWAGLKEFKKDLATQASEFRFLPKDDLEKEISTEAYDIHYEGSVNKLRSIIGVRENSTKLSRHLFERMLRYWLGDQKGVEEKDLDQVRRFYRGSNILDYCRTLERVFTFLVSTDSTGFLAQFFYDSVKTIEKLQYTSEFDSSKDLKVTEMVKENTKEYLKIALSSVNYVQPETKSFLKSNLRTFLWGRIDGRVRQLPVNRSSTPG